MVWKTAKRQGDAGVAPYPSRQSSGCPPIQPGQQRQRDDSPKKIFFEHVEDDVRRRHPSAGAVAPIAANAAVEVVPIIGADDGRRRQHKRHRACQRFAVQRNG